MGNMYYHVINVSKGNVTSQGVYKSKDSANARADKVFGGQTHVFGPLPTTDPIEGIRLFKKEAILND